jgi:hypothetical protein
LGEPVDELLYGEDGNVKGIRSKEEVYIIIIIIYCVMFLI